MKGKSLVVPKPTRKWKIDAVVKAKMEKLFGGIREPATLATNNPKPARQRAASANPKGIASSSPRLRGTSYLGSRFANGNQPQRGCDQNRSIGVATKLPQPRWGCSRFATFTQGRRGCANLRLWATAPLGLTGIPTGFSPSAQGCEERATLGHGSQMETNPNGVVAASSKLKNGDDKSPVLRLHPWRFKISTHLWNQFDSMSSGVIAGKVKDHFVRNVAVNGGRPKQVFPSHTTYHRL